MEVVKAVGVVEVEVVEMELVGEASSEGSSGGRMFVVGLRESKMVFPISVIYSCEAGLRPCTSRKSTPCSGGLYN